MPSLKETRRRIKSIESIIKVTNAMQIISASRMKKFQDEINRIRTYQEKIEEIMKNLSTDNSDKNKYFLEHNQVDTILLLVFSTQRGLAGGLPNNIYKMTSEFIKTKHAENKKIKVINLGNKIAPKIKGLDVELIADFSTIAEKPTAQDMKSLLGLINKIYLQNEAQEVYAIYPKFVNALIQKVISKKILPIKNLDSEPKSNQQFTYEPNKNILLNSLIRLYLENLLLLQKTETVSSEYSARMTAMKAASENASDIKINLSMEYNKTRQTQITQEIAQITSGSVQNK